MAKYNRTCYTCSSKYHYCPTCQDELRDPKIYTMFCCEKCQSIFLTLAENGSGKVDAETCKKNLLSLNITENDKMSLSVKEHFDRVMATKLKENIKEIDEEVVETTYKKKK